jgi:tRNA pseudouridine38-40 synthase
MPRYFAKISYVGTAYNGWQVQDNTPRTIQQVMNENISALLNEKIVFTGCGRTDTGVHAREFFAHFDSEKKLDDPHLDWAYKCSSVLPNDIVVHKIIAVKKDAHARFDAISRTYNYFITQQRDPFLRDRAYFIYADLDLEKMNEACMILFEHHDFSCFSKTNTQVRTNKCKITEALFKKKDPDETGAEQIVFTVTADRFLRNMVRAIVGTMLEIGKNKITKNDLVKIIEGKSRSEAGVSVPAHGLFLTSVKYDWDKIKSV